LKNVVIALSAALLLSFVVPTGALAQSQALVSLLGQANQMNNEEQDMAKELASKAGDNQALTTMADTMRDDHKANQAAVEALANKKNITLKSYEKNQAAQDKLDSLKGANFNKVFLDMDIKDHEKAIASFREAKTTLGDDPDSRVYIDQTIPVLESHLKMAENMRHDDARFGSHENPTNNKSK
jgi:predicted outer membrane protein